MSKENAVLNGEWGKHVNPYLKRLTAKRRRRAGKQVATPRNKGASKRPEA